MTSQQAIHATKQAVEVTSRLFNETWGICVGEQKCGIESTRRSIERLELFRSKAGEMLEMVEDWESDERCRLEDITQELDDAHKALLTLRERWTGQGFKPEEHPGYASVLKRYLDAEHKKHRADLFGL